MGCIMISFIIVRQRVKYNKLCKKETSKEKTLFANSGRMKS